MTTIKRIEVLLRITARAEDPKPVKVMAYTRIINGRKVKVKAYWRRG